MPSVVERVVGRFDPLRVILFGSLACGEPNYDSDVDLLLVIFDRVKLENKRGRSVEISRALAGIPVPVDVIVTDVDEIRRRGHLVGPILRPALEERKVVYERP